MASQTTPATFDWCQTSWSTEMFVLVSSWWRLSYCYHIDHLEHSYLQMIMKKLFYTGLLSCQSLADSLAFIQIVAFVKIRRWVFYFSIVPWTSKHCHIHKWTILDVASQTTPATFDWCQTSWSTKMFVLVSSWWRLSYRYHIDHLEHSGKNVGQAVN